MGYEYDKHIRDAWVSIDFSVNEQIAIHGDNVKKIKNERKFKL